MRTRIMLVKLTAGLACAAAALTTAPGTAQASPKLTDAQFYDIVAAGAKTGTYTTAQRAQLLSRPDLAARTLDVTSVQTGTVETDTAATAAATRTRHVDRYVRVPAFLNIGNGFEFHLTVSWSYTGSKVLNPPSWDSYLRGAGEYPGVRIKSTRATSRWTRANHYSIETVINGVWHQCVRDVCIGGNGVRGQYGLYGNGDYTFSGRVQDI